MFDNIRKKIKGMIHKVTGNTTIIEALGVNPATSAEMREAISLWTAMYMNKAEWLSDEPTVDEPIKVVSLGLPAAIASEKACMACLELKSEITCPGNDTRGEFLNDNYQRGIIQEIRKQSEYAIAKGSLAITPYVILDDGKPRFAFDFTQADKFIPIGFDTSGKIVDVAFLIRKDTTEYIYYRLERQTYNHGVLHITNKAYKRTANGAFSNDNADIYDIILGDEINLADVPEWAHLRPELEIKGVDRLFTAVIKMPHANTIDTNSPLGVSGYARAVELIKQADIQHARLDWEFKASLTRIDIDQEALKDKDGNDIDRIPAIFRMRDAGDVTAYNVYAPTLRSAAYIEGMDEILTRIEDACALSRGTLSRATDQARTATELKILRQRTYSENADIQQSIQKALEDVVYIMNAYCDIYPELVPGGNVRDNNGDDDNAVIASDGAYDVSFEWDDSIIVDRETELQQRLTLMERGIAGRVENRMWYYGETEEQAIEALKRIDEENGRYAGDNLQFQFPEVS